MTWQTLNANWSFVVTKQDRVVVAAAVNRPQSAAPATAQVVEDLLTAQLVERFVEQLGVQARRSLAFRSVHGVS